MAPRPKIQIQSRIIRCCRRLADQRFFVLSSKSNLLFEVKLKLPLSGAHNPYYLLASLNLRLRASQDGRF